MSFLRYDCTTGDWVILAPERIWTPHELRRAEASEANSSESVSDCPFCRGNESLTPQEIYAERPAGAAFADWQVRVIPSKFPALRIEGDPHRHNEPDGSRYLGGFGAHEVIVESPDHNCLLFAQPADQVERVLRTAQGRHQDLMRDARIQAVVIFKNHGEGAGSSLRHPHCQLIATPIVPSVLRSKHQVATQYFDQTGDCLYCVMLQRELDSGRRIVATNDDFVALMPYASHVPFETWIVPRHHFSSFAVHPREQLRTLAELLIAVLRKLHGGLHNPDFNLTIDSVARGDELKSYFLWHLRILPRLTISAGFELGSGMSINTLWPEDAASFLRQLGDADPGSKPTAA